MKTITEAPPAKQRYHEKGRCQVCGRDINHRFKLCREHSNSLRKGRSRAKQYYHAKAKVKTQQRQIAEGLILTPDNVELIYENYKEPLKTVLEEKGGGFGYMGTVAQNKERTHVQCHICGLLFKTLGSHINRTHKMNAREYKQEFGLALTTALVADEPRKKLIESREVIRGRGLPDWLKKYNEDVRSGKRRHRTTNDRTHALELHNKKGTCPDQCIAKIQDLAKKLKRVPSFDEFRDEYNHRYYYSIQLHFGTFTNAIKAAGFKETRKEQFQYTKEQLIELLQNFQKKYDRYPTTSDFKRGLLPVQRGTYNYHFGTLNHARIAAGMPALIPLSGGLFIEVPAEKFGEYESFTHGSYKNKYERRLAFKEFVETVSDER